VIRLKRGLKWGALAIAAALALFVAAFPGIFWREVGMLYLGLEDSGRARVCFEFSLRTRPNDADSLCGLGVACGESERWDEAVAAFEKAVSVQPKDADLHYNLGLTYDEVGRPRDAIRQYEAAAQLDPSSVDALVNLALAQVKLKQFDEAVTTLHRAAEAAPDDAEVQYELGLELFVVGKDEEARRQCDILKDLDPALAEKLESIMRDPKARERLRGDEGAGTGDAAPRGEQRRTEADPPRGGRR
jgi:Flp pilus assembly protein TadD